MAGRLRFDSTEDLTVQKNKNAFGSMENVLGGGVDAFFTDDGPHYSLVFLDDIEVLPQIREILEDEDHPLADLADDIKARGVLQPILIRQTDTGYVLIAGERRYRACRMAGLGQIPAYIRIMTDEEAEDAQFAENIHRKNLTQIEEAKKIQRDLDRLGSIQAVLQHHHKGKSWASKILGLLNLPDQAKRLITENVSADIELIHTVKTIEKKDPEVARQLVDDLKETRGTKSARGMAASVKKQVIPPKQEQSLPAAPILGKPKKSAVTNLHAEGHPMSKPPAEILRDAYRGMAESGATPKKIFKAIPDGERQSAETWLRGFYDAGRKSKVVGDAGQTVIRNLRSGQFTTEGAGAFALLAFLKGSAGDVEFDVLKILGDCHAIAKAPD